MWLAYLGLFVSTMVLVFYLGWLIFLIALVYCAYAFYGTAKGSGGPAAAAAAAPPPISAALAAAPAALAVTSRDPSVLAP